MLSIQITKFKLRQYQWRAIFPNVILVKVTRYMVVGNNYMVNQPIVT